MQEAVDSFRPDEKDKAVAPPAPANDWMQEAVDSFEPIDQTGLVVDSAVRRNPTNYADNTKKAKALGVAPEDIEASPEEMGAEYNKKLLNESISKSSTLRNMYGDPEFAFVAHDDHKKLLSLDERLQQAAQLQFLDEVSGRKEASLVDIMKHAEGSMPELWASQIAGNKAAYYRDELQQLYKERNRRAEGGERHNPLEKFAGFVLENSKVIEELAKYEGLDVEKIKAKGTSWNYTRHTDEELTNEIARVEQAFDENIGAFTLAQEDISKSRPYTKSGSVKDYVSDAMLAFHNMIPALTLGFVARRPLGVTGGAAVGGGVIGAQVFGTAYTENYQKYGDHEKAVSAGLVHMSAEGIGEMLPLGFVLKRGMGPVKKLLAVAGAEGLEEVVTEAIQLGYDEAWLRDDMTFPQALKELFGTEERRSYVWERLKKAGITGAMVGGAMGTVGVTVDQAQAHVEQKEEEIRATVQQTQEWVSGLGDEIKDTQLNQRAPDQLEKFVKEAVGETDQEVFIDIDEFIGYWQTTKEGEIEKIVDAIPGMNEQIEEALTSGGDIRLSLAEYSTKIAATEHNEAFSEIIRLDQRMPSAAQAKASEITIEEDTPVAQEEISAAQSADIVRNNIADQLVTTGKYNRDTAIKMATLHSSFAKVVARHTGQTPEDVYKAYPLKIQAGKMQGEKEVQGYTQPPVYAQARNAVRKSETQTATSEQWKEVLGKAPKETLKWLDNQKGEVSKEAILENINENIAAEQLLFQDERGAISFTDEGALMTLLENADLSTFFHETGHYFFEVMNNLAQTTNNEQVLKDVEALVKFVGVKSVDVWVAMSVEERRIGHEKVANAFEEYLMEGNAPSAELKGVFQRFRDWLLDVYNSIKRTANLTDDVRMVFDRMLASQDSINAAKRARQYLAMFDSAEQAGWTDEAFATYQKNIDGMAAAAQDELQTRLIKDMKWLSGAKHKKIKSLQREAQEKRAQMAQDVRSEVEQRQIYKDIAYIRYGDERGPAPKINLATVKEMYSASETIDWERLGYGKNGMLAAEGADPHVLADVLGYQGADDLIQTLLATPPIGDVVSEITDIRMLEKYGDITSEKAMTQAAHEELHNALRERVLIAEYSAIAKATGAIAPTIKAAKTYAKKAIARQKVRDIKPSFYANAEASSAKKAEKALFDADLKGAAQAKLTQMINNQKYKAAVDAEKEINKKITYLKKFDNAGVRKRLDIDYLEQIDAIRAQFDLRKSVTLREIDKRKTLGTWIKDQQEMGYEPILDEDLIENIKKKHYKDMTLDELRDVTDAVVHIEHLGRLKNKLIRDVKNRELTQIKEELDQSIEQNAKTPKPEKATPTHKLGKLMNLTGDLGAWMRTEASIINQLDGYKDGGVAYEHLYQGKIEAASKQFQIIHDSNKVLLDAFERLGRLKGVTPKNLYAFPQRVPGTTISMTHEQRIMLALYWGDSIARQRILDNGLAGHRGLTEQEVTAIIDTLTEKDVTFIKTIWAHLESFRPQISEQERRRTGIEPKWIDPAPYMTKYGMLNGGYVPVKYDAELSADAWRYEAMTQDRAHMGGLYASATTAHTYTKARAENVLDRPLLFSFDTITQHINEVATRLAWEDYLFDAKRILKDISPTIRKYHGPKLANQLENLLVDIAKGDGSYDGPWVRVLSHLRAGSVIAGIGFNLMSAAIQPTGLFVGWEKLGTKWFAKGLMHAQNPIAAYKQAISLSEPLRQRWEGSFQREINEAVNRARKEGLGIIANYSFALVGRMQMMVDIPVFLGAYEKYIAQLGMENAVDDAAREDISAKASEMAYKAVTDSQSGGHLYEMAGFMRNQNLKIFTVFLNYFNMLYNRNVELYHKTNFKKLTSYPGASIDFLMINIFPIIASVLIREALKGDCEWDTECLVKKAEKEGLQTATAQLFLLRELGVGLEYLVLDEPNYFGYGGPSGLRFFGEFAKLGKQAWQGEDDIALAKAISGVLGPLLYIPSTQLNKTMEGAAYVSDGNASDATDAMQAILFGPPKEQK